MTAKKGCECEEPSLSTWPRPGLLTEEAPSWHCEMRVTAEVPFLFLEQLPKG